ncbi:hypothetical protein BS47DRAFT_723257 [Hydnum rufescens UP504]|uniref:Uncharacterized protein n=1 Tax=Hydnum rufescens UP504 TaxID=1448309 RepID=A0A9P6DYN2_9AGAM|nr:hypothetical protein BS47DRAFT_723257 [Hydnum rufescens UP504]
MSNDTSKYVQIHGSVLTSGDSKPAPDTLSSSPQRSTFSFIGAPSRPPPLPKTPSFTGFRNLFGAPPPSPSTPVLNGLRQLFRSGEPQDQPSGTPDFSGVGDMFDVAEDENDESSDTGPEEHSADEENSPILNRGDSAKISSVATGNAVSRRQYAMPEPLPTAVPKRGTRSTRRTTPVDSNHGFPGKASMTKEEEQESNLSVVIPDSIAAPRATRSGRVRVTTDSSGVIDSKRSTRSSRAPSKTSSRIPTSTVSRPKREKNKFTEAEEPQIKTEDEGDGHGEEPRSHSRTLRRGAISAPGDQANAEPRSTNRKAKPTTSSVRATNIPVKATSSRRTRASPIEAARPAVSNRRDDSDTDQDSPSVNTGRPAATKTHDTSSSSRVQRSSRKVPYKGAFNEGKVQDHSLANSPQEPKRLGASEDDERTRPKTSTVDSPEASTTQDPCEGF